MSDTIDTPSSIGPKKTYALHEPQGHFGQGINWLGIKTLYLKEVRRFLKVYMQTLIAPVATTVLFVVVFSLAFAERRAGADAASFVAFLIPGVVMMSIIQNAYSNSSSSMIIAKMQGIIVDLLMPPLSAGELTFAIVAGAVTRGLMIACISGLITLPFLSLGIAHPFWVLFFVLCGASLLALIGLMTGIWAEKFDQTAAITNFLITPMAFLSGTFYKVSNLPAPWSTISLFNPIFYLIDGLRYGVLGKSEANPWLGATICLTLTMIAAYAAWKMLKRGYKIKH